ncbi:hypothetical protein D3C76_985950 [compost metagenome]
MSKVGRSFWFRYGTYRYIIRGSRVWRNLVPPKLVSRSKYRPVSSLASGRSRSGLLSKVWNGCRVAWPLLSRSRSYLV